mgnify:FL=1
MKTLNIRKTNKAGGWHLAYIIDVKGKWKRSTQLSWLGVLDGGGYEL